MEKKTAISALSALAHEARLAIYRLLVQIGPQGTTVGHIATKLDLPGATLSFHLAHLKRAGLVTSHRTGRQLIQTADFRRMNALVGYLTENCCGGNPEACLPVAKTPAKINARKKACA